MVTITVSEEYLLAARIALSDAALNAIEIKHYATATMFYRAAAALGADPLILDTAKFWEAQALKQTASPACAD